MLAQVVFEIALVVFGQILDPVAVDHHGRRVRAAGMCETQLDRLAAYRWRLVGGDGGFQHAGQIRGAELETGRALRTLHRTQQLAQTGTMQCRNRYVFGPGHEAQAPIQRGTGLFALIVGQAIPFVDRDHQGAPSIQHQSEHGGVLVGDAFAGIDHEHHHLCRLDGLQGLDDAEFLDRFVDLGLAPDAGGVDQAVLAPVAFHVDRNRIARGARHIGGDHPVFAQQAVDQGGLADIGAADDRQAQAVRLGRFHVVAGFIRLRQMLVNPFQHGIQSTLVCSGYRNRFAQAEACEFGHGFVRIGSVDLVDQQQHWFAAAAQLRQDRFIQRQRALLGIDHEQNQARLFDRGLRLARGETSQALFVIADAAGIHQQERLALDPPADAVMTVAGDAGLVVHQRIAGAGEGVEKGRFADVGPANQGDQWQHGDLTQKSGTGPQLFRSGRAGMDAAPLAGAPRGIS